MDPVKRIDVHFLGEKNYPAAMARVIGPLAEGFPELFAKAQKINPAISVDEVIRQVLDLGTRKLNANIARGILQEPKSAPAGGQAAGGAGV